MLRFGPYTLDVEKCNVQREDWPKVGLTRFEATILETLAKQAGQVVPRDEINAALYGSGPPARVMSPHSNGIEVFVRRIRVKLDPIGEIGLIKTVRGQGYMLRSWPQENIEQAA